MPNHTVKQGECLPRIARQYGFSDYLTVYNDPGNAALRQKRPNPNVLYPGDVVFIPDKVKKQVSKPTTQVHQFVLTTTVRMLRIVVKGLDGKPMASKPYQLDVEGNTTTGVIGGDGLIEKAIPFDAENGSLTVGRFTWPLAIAHLNPVDEADDDGVTGIQARLSNLGYQPGPVDGILGPLTEAAIMAFQVDSSLDVDGICGPDTSAALLKAHGC
jgi:hypothetical protein